MSGDPPERASAPATPDASAETLPVGAGLADTLAADSTPASATTPVRAATPPRIPTSPSTGASDSRATGPRGVDLAPQPLDERGFDARYSPGKLLGRGGMGEVRQCEDRRIGREVAVKVMRGQAAALGDGAARFVREARIQGQLEHPAIVPVHDLGVGPDGLPYFTMKRLRGLTLEQILSAQQRGDTTALEQHSRRKLLGVFATVCHAIEFAHARGVLHRDLKPSNIMLGDFGEVYVLDWGVARVAGAPDHADADADAAGATPAAVPASSSPGTVTPAATAYGAVLGTPGYMSPEQLRGEHDKLDARADVYALGAILFELLTLTPLHARASTDVIMASTLAGADARACTRAPQRDIALELEAICIRASARDAAARYPSARELVTDLERYLDGDRDLERRRAAAATHAEHAARAASRADSDPAARREAMREAGRALALDPAQVGALRVITQLMLTPPRETPPEVARAMQETEDDASRAEARVGGFAYLVMLFFIPVFMWMGIRSYPQMLTMAALVVLGSGLGFAFSRARVLSPSWLYVAIVANAITMGMGSRIVGPFMLIPGVAATATLGFAMHARLQRVWLTMAIGCAAIVLPLLLELTGVISPTLVFEGGVVALVPRGVDLPRTATLVALTAGTLAGVITPTLMMLHFRKSLEAAERKMRMQAWQLEQLVPAQEGGAGAE
ncbi:MAG: protein kinase [Deltaproteobacteria bacterium]|nr:protein kinase [Deltaproteobacteria bacterium]